MPARNVKYVYFMLAFSSVVKWKKSEFTDFQLMTFYRDRLFGHAVEYDVVDLLTIIEEMQTQSTIKFINITFWLNDELYLKIHAIIQNHMIQITREEPMLYNRDSER